MILVTGSANLDFAVHASHIPAPGETVMGRDFKTFTGGKGANQAVACARAGAAATHMLLALGDDAYALPLEASQAEAGVLMHIVASRTRPPARLSSVSRTTRKTQSPSRRVPTWPCPPPTCCCFSPRKPSRPEPKSQRSGNTAALNSPGPPDNHFSRRVEDACRVIPVIHDTSPGVHDATALCFARSLPGR